MMKTVKTFNEFLMEQKYDKRTIESICSRINRIKNEYDIEAEYISDKCAEILEDFTYTAADERKGLLPNVKITIQGSYAEGLASLKGALKHYIKYLDSVAVVKKVKKKSTSFFEGSLSDFISYVGPKCRNSIQALTKGKKKSVEYCECCGAKKTLQAAHVNGMERNDIIKRILESDYKISTDYYRVCLEEFAEKFKNAHMPLDDAFYFLCSSCHSKYDGKDSVERDRIDDAVKATRASRTI